MGQKILVLLFNILYLVGIVMVGYGISLISINPLRYILLGVYIILISNISLESMKEFKKINKAREFINQEDFKGEEDSYE